MRMQTKPFNHPVHLNEVLKGFSCIRCGHQLPVGDYQEGCPSCADGEEPSSLAAVYQETFSSAEWQVAGRGRGMARFGAMLPYSSFPTLGEGDTPFVEDRRLAAELGVNELYLKNEFQNPTGSHKDRMSALVCARALDLGGRSVVAASSGNAGASLAAYAAAAGLPCTIVTTHNVAPTWREAIEITGAKMLYANNSKTRWLIVSDLVRNEGFLSATNFLVPPVGSNPYGVEGYKTVAYEMHEERPDALDAIVVSVARADLLWGIFRGYRELIAAGLASKMPCLFAVEPYPRLTRVLAGEPQAGDFPGTTRMSSIAGSTVTYQAVDAVKGSNGGAIAVDDAETEAARKEVGRRGVYLEMSAAATVAGLRKLLAQGELSGKSRVALVATSSGYKDPSLK